MRGRKNTETAVCAVTFFLLSPRIRLKHTHTHTHTHTHSWKGTAEDIHVKPKTFHCETQKSRLDGKPANLVQRSHAYIVQQ